MLLSIHSHLQAVEMTITKLPATADRQCTPKTILAAELLANDTDVEGNTLSLTNVVMLKMAPLPSIVMAMWSSRSMEMPAPPALSTLSAMVTEEPTLRS